MSKAFTAFALCLTLFSTMPAFAASADERAQAAIDTRQGLLKVVVSYFGPIVGMAREQIPYDADVVKNNAEKVALLLPMIPDVFRNDTREFALETEALDDIWENMDDFTAKSKTATERALALAAATADGQEAAMKAFGALGAGCKGCHDNYRQQN
jgi:cytochrome c556